MMGTTYHLVIHRKGTSAFAGKSHKISQTLTDLLIERDLMNASFQKEGSKMIATVHDCWEIIEDSVEDDE